MKTLTTILAAVMVMAATGCETPQQKEARGLMLTPYGDWVPKGTPYFGDGRGNTDPPWMRNRTASSGDIGPIPNLIPVPVYPPAVGSGAPQPVVVTGGNYPVTTVSPDGRGGSTIVNYGVPSYSPPVAPYPYYGY